MEERKLDKINKTIRRTVKGSPLLIIVLLAVIIFAVGAALFQLFVSGPTTGVYEFDTDVRGLDAQLIQAGNYAAYSITAADATTLVPQMHGLSNEVLFASNCAILVIHDYDLPTEDLTMTIKVFETGTEIPYSGTWSCTSGFVEFYNDGNGRIVPDGSPTPSGEPGEGTWTITNLQIEDMVYSSTHGGPASGDENALILSFTFPDLETETDRVEYSADWSISPDDYTTDLSVDVIVTLSVDA